ncbi:MAG: metallophosphoesterase [Meiothermus sp.]|uniref:metallophosphoesterase family protein n=1 Tax=Meiothermus sp. TaxID=1955249 RepID=UPI0025D74650|nr:metallophosphoesterase [Meiothermus sp.]MCS7067225.1 metallophosphoesterase [Meiothermus sp.]MCX7600621.1 metallophosphoesterase [Meiothermus sp.]MDW8426025.1 metallophosphoesterase [Meiothermus sp.]
MRKLLGWLVFGLCLSAAAQRVAVIGDWGAESPHRPLVAAALREQHQQSALDALLTVGDNFYPRGEPILKYLQDLPPVRIFPAFGNHDAPALQKQLELFKVKQPYYTVRLGSVEVFVLYSEDFGLAQRRWLEAALKASGAPWKIVALHRPLYSSGPHGGARSLRQALEPLFTRYRVSLVLSGHEHSYERLEARGIVHIVTGGGGAWLRGFVSVRPESKVRLKSPHFLILEASAERLRVVAYNEKNTVIDQVQLGQ